VEEEEEQTARRREKMTAEELLELFSVNPMLAVQHLPGFVMIGGRSASVPSAPVQHETGSSLETSGSLSRGSGNRCLCESLHLFISSSLHLFISSSLHLFIS